MIAGGKTHGDLFVTLFYAVALKECKKRQILV